METAYYMLLVFSVSAILGGLAFAFFPTRQLRSVKIKKDEDFLGMAGDFPVFPEDFKPVAREKSTLSDVVGYKSRKRGNRLGVLLGCDNSGRMIIHLDEHPYGVLVRRQPHLIKRIKL